MNAANQEYQNAQGQTADAQAKKDEAWSGAIESGIGLAGSFFGG